MPDPIPGQTPEDEIEKPSEEQLPEDLKQEKQEIEVRIEQHITKLQEIAEVFGIDTSKFSDENDQKSAEKAKKQRDVIRKLYQENGINPFEGLHTRFKVNHDQVNMDNFSNSGEIGESIAKQVKERGRIYSLWHPNDSILQAARNPSFCFSNDEATAVSYFEYHHGEIDYGELKIKLPSKLGGLEGSEISQRAHCLAGRLFNEIGEIFNGRICYLLELAESGQRGFKEVEEESTKARKVYEVDPSFQFTEEDAKKAAELNLPWSKIEKEMAEKESTES